MIFFLYSYICPYNLCYMRYYLTILLTFLSIASFAREPLREVYPLNSDWRFFYADEPTVDRAGYVTLPHTWNNDIFSEGREFRYASANYVREVYIPADMSGKRLFLRFGGVQSVANLFVNGQHIGEHRGGYTAFTFEITEKVNFDATNLIMVVVSNSNRSDVLPTSTELNPTGGIYREVELLVTERNIVTPLYYSSDGVQVVQQQVDKYQASGVVRVRLSTPDTEHPVVNLRIVAPDGYEAFYKSVRVAKAEQRRTLDIEYSIPNPQLWSPSEPNLYSVEVCVEHNHRVEDMVVVQTGFRKVSINADNRLCINDEVVEVRGVNMAHDRQGEGMAITRSHMDEDLAAVASLGANALRSLTGPHHPYIYDACDRRGVLVWVDMPFTRAPMAFSDICYYPTEAFRENGFEQLREIIMQNYNHPSVVMWGLFSLVWQRGDDPVGYVKELNDLAHNLDASRLTVGCSNTDGAINFITDLIVLRQNVGWYKGMPEDIKVWCRQLQSNAQWRKLRSGVCYGEEGSVDQQGDEIVRAKRGSLQLPERRQTQMHEIYSHHIAEADIFWGVWLDNLFDYGSSRRAYGLNQSGLIGYDHRQKKDAYYLYRAKWNERATTPHIAEGAWRERSKSLQSVKVYSREEPQVYMNNDTLSVRRHSEGVWVADSVHMCGEVTIRAYAPSGIGCDSVQIRVGSVRAHR